MSFGCGDIDKELVQMPGQSAKAFCVPTKAEMEKSLLVLVEQHAIKWVREAPALKKQHAAQEVPKKEVIAQQVSRDLDKLEVHDEASNAEGPP